MQKVVKQHFGKVAKVTKFEHMMALSLNPKTNYSDGVIRCITSRQGKLSVAGYIDKSEIYLVKEIKKFENYKVTKKLNIKGTEKLIKHLSFDNLKFIGFEDPDIIIDSETDLIHLYFTIPFVNKSKRLYRVYLGHAQGKELENLTMTDPVLPPGIKSKIYAKELAVAPINKSGKRLNLFESKDAWHSTVRVAEVEDLTSDWKLRKTIIVPKQIGYKWISGHASPGPLLPKEFIDPGENKIVGILNGRVANSKEGDKIIYKEFSVGLMIYDYEKGKVDWISKKPLIMDTDAKIITFASQFIQIKSNEGILYAHVDDSFVRAYTLYSDELKKVLKNI